MSSIEIIPAIMPKSFKDLQEKYFLVKDFADIVQIDVMDGRFTPTKSWPYIDISSQKSSRRPCLRQRQSLRIGKFEVDLMVLEPQNIVEDWIIEGAKRVIIHIESIEDIKKVFLKIPKNIEIGIALNTTTQDEEIYPLIKRINFVQFMGIEKIGFQGQKFDKRVIEKIKDLREKFSKVIISVDGGVNLNTALELIKAGANRIVIGSAIFESKNIKETIEKFKNLK